MTTELGKRLAGLDVKSVKHPGLRRLVLQLRGTARSPEGGFNDRHTIHSDYVNRRTEAHTDLASEKIPCPEYDDCHSDTETRDGHISSHSDYSCYAGTHTDSGHSDYYSDMTR